jgi:thymidylate synthase (FAD)
VQPYAELLEFNQPNPIRLPGFTRIRDAFPELKREVFRSDLKPTRKITSMHYDPERISEFAGRWDYGQANAEKLGQEAKAGGSIIRRWIASGEQSMLEMGHATVFFECSRVVTHELVRHRLASYQQESQRFTKYDEEEPEGLFIVPFDMKDAEIYDAIADDRYGGGETNTREVMERLYAETLRVYKMLREAGVAPQHARYVFPNGIRTRIIMSTNIREWRHVLRLRLDKSAQPEMRQMMQMAYDQLIMVFPQSLEGITEEGRGVR